jgi:hypothetical protein
MMLAEPANADSIPGDAASLTPVWLTAALRRAGALHHASVTSVRHDVVGEVQGFTGQVTRLRLTYDRDEPGAPVSLVAKLPAASAEVRAALHGFGLYEREVCFYREIAAPGSPAPHAWLAESDPQTGASILLLEDLTAGRIGDNVGGCADEEAILAVSEIARFHAAWWNHPRLPRLPAFIPIAPEAFQADCQALWEPFRAKVGDLLPARLEAQAPRLLGRVADYRRWLSGPPYTLAHGDFRLDNMFFGGTGAPRRFAVFDWQLSLLARGVSDVAYFAAFCLPPAQRRRLEQELVAVYHGQLAANGVTGYGREQCWHDYRISAFGALLRVIVALAIVDYSTERGGALARALIERTDAMLADHPVGELLSGSS